MEPKMKSRKPRSDGTSAAIYAMQAACRTMPEPPLHMNLRPGDLAFWPAVISARSIDEWDGATIVLAAQLCRTQFDLEAESTVLMQEGSVIDGKVNPRAAHIDVLSKRQMALMRALRIAGGGLGKTTTIENARVMEMNARSFEYDDLIPRC